MSISKKVPSRTLTAVLLASVFSASALAGAAADGPDIAALSSTTDRMIVKYKAGASAATSLVGGLPTSALDRVAASHGLTMAYLRTTGQGAQVMKLSRAANVSSLREVARQMMQADASIEYAEPDRRMFPMLTPNDSRYSELWAMYEATGGIKANTAWDTTNGAGVVVAVIDTGIRTHSDLTGQTVAGYDMILNTTTANDGGGRDNDPSDPGDWTTGQCGPASNSSWHGTHVAGTVAARGNDGAGVIGVAYGAKVQNIRALGTCGGFTSDIADGIIWAAGGTVSGVPANATPSKVINLSLGGGGACDTTTQNAINSARSRGATIVVAAGNSNANAANFSPASCAGVITVAATGRNGGRAPYSNFGANVDVAAPGGDTRTAGGGILSTLNAGTRGPGAESYASYQGTSMAAPHVAGLAALLYAVRPASTPDQIEAAIKNSARAFPATCSQCGTGIIDAPAAIAAITGGGGGGGGTTRGETESNNTTATANLVTAPATVNASLSTTTDTDYFRVDVPAGRTLRATLNPGSTRDFDVVIYNSSGTQVAISQLGTGQVDTATSANTGTSTVTRFVRVRYYSGGAGTYSLGLSW